MAKNTRDKLLDAALDMFSHNGYAGTNIRELSAALGLGKSSLYRHFESKEEIWNAVIDTMQAYYAQHFGSSEQLPPVPKSTDELKALTLQLLNFSINDDRIIKMRKLLLTEQFHDTRARTLATEHFNVGLERMFTKLFAGMIDNGSLKGGDAGMLAFIYTAPISSLVLLCDREPDMRELIIKKISAFIDHFIITYGGEKNECK